MKVVLTVAAACRPQTTAFTGIRRLRIKESDRVAAMENVLERFGVDTRTDEDSFTVEGRGEALKGGKFSSFDDHRIAMAIAVGATVADDEVEIDNPDCVSKSYPGFFDQFSNLKRGWAS